MTLYTANFRLKLPDYNQAGWDGDVDDNFLVMDAVLAQFVSSLNMQGAWQNSTLYEIAQSVIDPTDGSVWICNQRHTSSPTPTTFTDDRTINFPAAWTNITNPALTAQAYATQAAASAAQAASSAVASIARNRLHNGSMEITQRGVGPFVTGSYGADRWLYVTTGAATTANVQTNAGFTSRRQLCYVGTHAIGQGVSHYQRIEAANSYDLVGQQVTFSVNSQHSISAGVVNFNVTLSYANVVDNFGAVTPIQALPIVLVPAGSTVSITFNALPVGAANGLQLTVNATQASAPGNLTWNITSLQLEPGNVATAFERVPYAHHLYACRRYYETGEIGLWGGYNVLTAIIGLDTPFGVVKRISPTVALSNQAYLNAQTAAVTVTSIGMVRTQANVIATGPASYTATYTASAEL